MIRPGRPTLALAAMLFCAVATTAAAQTFIVQNVPAGGKVEVVLNSTPLGTGTPDAKGDARVPTNAFTKPDAEAVVHVIVDACGTTTRIVFVERNLEVQPPAEGCTSRRDVTGFFVLRHVTTMVIDIGELVPSVRLRQGSIPSVWLVHGPLVVGPFNPMSRGLEVFAAGGIDNLRDAGHVLCGDVNGCTSSGVRPATRYGVAFWPIRLAGIEASYTKLGKVSANASSTTFGFNGVVNTEMYTVAAKSGLRLGRTRLFFYLGSDFHRAVTSTTEIVNDTSVTVNGTSQTLPGGTISSGFRTSGWGWMFGAGIDIWASDHFAFYTEAMFANVKGTSPGNEGAMNDHASLLLVGGRLHFGGR